MRPDTPDVICEAKHMVKADFTQLQVSLKRVGGNQERLQRARNEEHTCIPFVVAW
eukprot:m.169934 g.169934  ORF g.169934 m.169934 type:complete len:55 (+) comp39021_c1_seq1:150-314(+)